MEELKLNINAPLLSVRRFLTLSMSSNGDDRKKSGIRLTRGRTLPPQGSDFALDQVTDPVAVPFVWEQIPGKRKDGGKTKPRPSEDSAITPKLPPGRVGDIKHYLRKDFDAPKGSFTQIEANPTDCMTRLESFKDEMKDKGVSGSGNEDNDAYSDALDSLFPAESLSVNGCISGHSGSDGRAWKPSFSTDPQTRDIMMDRFLRAAKAMTLELPQYPSKKQSLTSEQPKEDKREVSEDRKPSWNQFGSTRIPHYGLEEQREEEESEDDEYPGSADISVKGCGLLPRLCSKNSLGILNSVKELKIRTRNVRSSTRDVKRFCRTANIQSQSPTVKKDTEDVVYKGKSNSGVQSRELPEIKNRPVGLRYSYSGELQTTGRSSPYRHSISAYHNGAPQSPSRVASFLGAPKDINNLKTNQFNLYAKADNRCQGVLSNQRTRRGSSSVNPAVEKTLYIDTVSNGDMGHSNLNSSCTKEHMDSEGKDFDILLKILGDDIAAEDSFHDVKCLNTSNGGGIVEPEIGVSNQSNKCHIKCQIEVLDAFGQDDEELKSTECGNLNDRINPKISKVCDPGKVEDTSGQSNLPPPLPKSPSESWLWRTPPSVAVHSSRSNRGNQVYTTKRINTSTSTSTKWETIVKTSKLHHDHVRYSEELISHASQQAKV